MEEDVRQKLHLDCVEVSTGMNMFGFSNSGRKPWVLQSGLAVDVPLNFNTTVDETGRTYLYPQGDLSVPPSGMMPKGGFFFDNITRGNIEFDEDTDSARVDFKDDFAVITDEQLDELKRQCDYYGTKKCRIDPPGLRRQNPGDLHIRDRLWNSERAVYVIGFV